MNKKSVFILLFVFITSMIIISTLSFYTPRIIDETTQINNTKLSNNNVEVNYVGNPKIYISNTQTTVVKTVTVKNNSSIQKQYILNLTDVINNIEDKTKLTYSYTCTGTGCSYQSDTKIPNSDFSLSPIRTINANITHTYTITFMYNGTPTGDFSGRFDIINTKNMLIASTGYSDTRFFWGQKDNITSIIFEDGISIPNGVTSWDVSNGVDGTVMAYIIDDDLGTSTYKLYIQSNGKIIANLNSTYLFYNFSKLKQIDNLSLLNTSNVTNMSQMFYGCSKLENIDLSSFDTSKVTLMNYMFSNCSGLAALDVSSLNTSNVTSMAGIFNACSNLAAIDVSSFNTSKVIDMSYMFGGCEKLTTLDVSTFNTSENTTMFHMFNGCNKLEVLDLSSFDTIKVIDMYCAFYNCLNLTTLDLSSFNTSNVTNMGFMFKNCSSLTALDLSTFNTSNVTYMASMFSQCKELTILDLSMFDTSNVVTMDLMFEYCDKIEELILSSFDTSKVTSMSYMFRNCYKLAELDLSSFNTSNVTNMTSMFSDCYELANIDLRNMVFTNVTTYTYMFDYVPNNITITVKDNAARTWILDKKSTANVIIA